MGEVAGDGIPAANLPEGVTRTQAGAALSTLLSASIGDVAVVMSRSPGHRHYTLSDIEWMILPAVLTGQFYVAQATSKEHGFQAPVACVTWASVSDDVDRRLRANLERKIRLRPDEWNSGKNLWLVDMAGDTRVLGDTFKRLLASRLKDSVVNVAMQSADGALRVETLASLADNGAEKPA